MKKIAVLASGGDSSGMNAAIRAVVRAGTYYGMEVFGVMRGYSGLIKDEISLMESRSVSGIINRGGTILLTSRCKEFLEPKGRLKAAENLKKRGIEGLVVIGGDGSFRGAHAFRAETDIKVVGVPGTIDNDLAGTDFTIGYDTAVNVAMDAIDKIRDTAYSHERLFLVEVMGRTAGYIALETGIAAGAEDILIPETKTDLEKVSQKLMEGKKRGKLSSIVVVAEGDDAGGAFKVAEGIAEKTGYSVKVAILGHVQRGGSPSAADRLLATRLGYEAVKMLAQGQSGVMAGIISGKVCATPLEQAYTVKKQIDPELIKVAEIMAL